MQQEQIPQLPVSEKTTWGELPDLLGAAVQVCEEKFGGCPPVLIFQPIEQSNFPGYQPTISQAPEELIVVTVIPRIRDAAFAALERVEAREPKHPGGPPPKMPKIKDNTPFKSVFRQMAAMPATVFSISLTQDDGENATIFFLRTAFTISEFRREMERPI
jgi:hypothetical protein